MHKALLNAKRTARPLISAGMVLGIGLGGFFDGILFHQILQLHNMLSARLPKATVANIEVNMFWDGLFHAFTWVFTVIGLAMLWNAVQHDVPLSTRVFAGSMILGWGVFNFVEGVINHHILNLHHVIENANHLPYDIAFLASGVVMIVIGWSMTRQPDLQW